MVTLVLIGFLMSSTPIHSAELENAVLAVVNGEIITLYEIDTATQHIALMKGAPLSDEALSELKRQILKRTIEDKLLAQELSRLNVEISDEEVEKRLAQILKENSLTEEQLSKILKNQGKSLSEFREDIRKQLGMEEYVRYKLRAGSLDVSEEEALTYYRLHKDDFGVEATVSLLILSWPNNKANLVGAEELYQKLLTKEIPIEPEKVEQEANQSGAKASRIERVKESELREDIANMIKGVNPPAPTGMHKGKDEITLIVLLDRTASEFVPFEQVKTKIINDLKNKKLEREFKFLIDELYHKSRVEIRMQF